MDMLFVEVDENVNLYDKVEILKDNTHIEEVAKYLETIPYEILCEIGVRVPRIYKNQKNYWQKDKKVVCYYTIKKGELFMRNILNNKGYNHHIK